MKIKNQKAKIKKLFSVVCNLLSKNSGFTLIEILVAITVILLLISFGFAGYASFNQRQTLISSGQTLKNFIRDAQSRAYNNEIDCTPGICDCTTDSDKNLTGWYVDITNKSIYGKCGNNPNFFEKPFNLSNNITIEAYLTPVPTQPVRILYKNSPPSVSQSAVICLSESNLPNSYYSISINNAGVVTDSEGIIPICP